MATDAVRFADFTLDAADRRLSRGGVPVELNARYLDALALLVREAGRLVSKDRFLDEVWRGVPVTDEALTQCIKTLRRQLGDDAANPRFIETVPKHGYRFIAPLDPTDAAPASDRATAPAAAIAGGASPWPQRLLLGAAGTVGGGLAGLAGGVVYGFASASPPGVGAASVLLVLVCVTILVAVAGGAGVAFGIAATGGTTRWSIAGGAAGGLAVGACAKLLGLDAFTLLVGRSPGDITGAAEGAVIGGAVGLAAWFALRRPTSLRRAIAFAAAIGGVAGAAVVVAGGRLLGGSLAALVREFPTSRLSLGRIGAVFGEDGFGPVSHVVTGAGEGALFAAGVVAAMLVARRDLVSRAPPSPPHRAGR